MKLNEFLEKFLPYYNERADVARFLDLDKYLSNKMTVSEQIEKELHDILYSHAYLEFVELQNKLHGEALQKFEYETLKKITLKVYEKELETYKSGYLVDMSLDRQLQLITFEQAKRLKKLGFDLECLWYYRDNPPDKKHTLLQNTFNIIQNFNADTNKVSAPSIAHALDWIEKIYYLIAVVGYDYEGDYFFVEILRPYDFYNPYDKEFGDRKTASNFALDEALTLLEKENEVKTTNH